MCFPDLSQSNLLRILKDLFILESFGNSAYYETAHEYRETISHSTLHFSDNRRQCSMCIYV